MNPYSMTPAVTAAVTDTAWEGRVDWASAQNHLDLLEEAGTPDRRPAYTPYKPMDLSGTGLAWDSRPVSNHGSGEWANSVHPGRLALAGYPVRPEGCTDDSGQREWILGGEILICLGCGLDCT